ncbi:MAG: type II secretion system F family protein [Oscillospiraceae bacterium]|jgi:tight adherence protein B|nr:type II secretion system F family protein [Oscillospiraceae bacterium]
MNNNIFAITAEKTAEAARASARRLKAPDYSVSPSGVFDHIAAFIIGFAAGFAVLFIFYKIAALSIIGGGLSGTAWIFVSSNGAVNKRKRKLRAQFFDLLEALSVSMRAGSPAAKAIVSARDDLTLLYPDESDIIVEVDIIIGKFRNTVPLSEAFADFAERSGIDDIAGFASIYATIEGKSSRANEIVRETQQIISDKMEIEMEIETLMIAAKSEVTIMLFMPLVILAVVGYAGAGFMDLIYTTTVGRLVATVGFILFIISFIMARKFSNVKL